MGNPYAIFHKAISPQAYAAAAPVCAEAAVMAAEVQRPDIAFAAWLLDLRIRRAAAQVTAAEALAILDTRLAATTDPMQRAELHFLAWEIAPHLATHREAAAATFTALYAQTPNIRYAQCLEVLTGSAPPPPALPPLPAFIAAEAAPLTALLDQVDATLARLQAQE